VIDVIFHLCILFNVLFIKVIMICLIISKNLKFATLTNDLLPVFMLWRRPALSIVFSNTIKRFWIPRLFPSNPTACWETTSRPNMLGYSTWYTSPYKYDTETVNNAKHGNHTVFITWTYTMRINYRSNLRNHIFTKTEQKYMMSLPFERGKFAVSQWH
jgi:hypothetical protein